MEEMSILTWQKHYARSVPWKHLGWIQPNGEGIDGSRVEKVLEAVHIAANKNTVPGDVSAMVPGGIRMGTPALTSRGFVEEDFVKVAEYFDASVNLALKFKAESKALNRKLLSMQWLSMRRVLWLPEVTMAVCGSGIGRVVTISSNLKQLYNLSYIDKLVGEAYTKWNELEEIDGVLNDNIALLTQGDQTVEQYPNNHLATVATTYHQNQYYGDPSIENIASYVPSNNAQMASGEWLLNQAYTTTPNANGFPFGFTGSQSDEDMTPSGSGPRDINGFTRQL